ncbi:hypothetical protein H8D29_00355 [PVC group bacterium]|nr:hypothetical protein [PVC group bacterium]
MPRTRNIENLKTEKKGILLLRSLLDGFMVPTKAEKKFLYDILGLNYKKYNRSIDGVLLHVDQFDMIRSSKDFTLIEIKTTKSKKVTELPYDVFFGFTENEEDLFRKVDNYRLCIVHTVMEKFVLITYESYLGLIKNKRVQYQINFKARSVE